MLLKICQPWLFHIVSYNNGFSIVVQQTTWKQYIEHMSSLNEWTESLKIRSLFDLVCVEMLPLDRPKTFFIG